MNAPENETRILITGANSFIGRHLIAHLLSETAGRPIRITAAVLPEQVAELSKPHSELQSSAGWSGATLLPQTQLAFADNDFAPGIPSVETAAQTLLPENERSASGEEAFPYAVLLEVAGADFTDPDSVTELIQRTRPTQIYHLSTNSAQEAERNSGVDAGRIFAADVQTTRNLLEAASRLSPFPRVLLAGEGCVYGSVAPERPAARRRPDRSALAVWRVCRQPHRDRDGGKGLSCAGDYGANIHDSRTGAVFTVYYFRLCPAVGANQAWAGAATTHRQQPGSSARRAGCARRCARLPPADGTGRVRRSV